MKEMRKNDALTVELDKSKGGKILEGKVIDYIKDRVMIEINNEYIDDAKLIKELDELEVTVYTHLGLKKMKSSVIYELNDKNCIILENNDSYQVEQKRKFARVRVNFNFKIKKDEKEFLASAINISAGGLAFKLNDEEKLNVSDKIQIELPKEEFEKDITANADIIKYENDSYVLIYQDINPYDEDKIVKYVFKLVSQK